MPDYPHGVPPAQAARACDLGGSHYKAIEAGEVEPGVVVLTKLAQGLQTTPSDLMKGIE